MAERSDDLQRSRAEAALLLRLDPQNLSPADELKCDLISTLRLSIDSAQADALEGRAADLGRLIVATESLVKLLPSETPKPAANHDADPRQVMWEIYKQMRERGELAGPKYSLDAALKRIAELEARLAGGSASALLDVPTNTEHARLLPTRDIVPPSERAECDAGPRAGPDDPTPRRAGPIIEAKANPPAASAAPAAKRTPNWDSTPGAAAWRKWVAAGGAHYDR
jgi:hypothetical protein